MPRIAAIHQGWRGIGPGVEALSARDGAPLSRTVKLIVVPLVLRPSEDPELAGSVVSAASAAKVATLLADHAETLRHCTRWFVLLVARLSSETHRHLSRDSCYAKAFELAVVHGNPDHHRVGEGNDLIAEALAEMSGNRAHHTAAQLRAQLSDSELVHRLSAELARNWRRTTGSATSPWSPTQEQRCHRILESIAPGGGWHAGARATAQESWKCLLADNSGSQAGALVRRTSWQLGGLDPLPATHLGLTQHREVVMPDVAGSAGVGARPWDRTVADRIAGVLQHTADRSELSDLVTMLEDEVDRICSEWQLGYESHRLVLVHATVLALGLTGVGADSSALRIVAAMRRRESWLAWAQRRPNGVAGVDELVDPVGPYLRRMWVRLHGSESRGGAEIGIDEVGSLLIGVMRSSLLDGRSKVRSLLAKTGNDAACQPSAPVDSQPLAPVDSIEGEGEHE